MGTKMPSVVGVHFEQPLLPIFVFQNMKLLSFALVVLPGAAAWGQLQNGSFENGGDSWVDPCEHTEYTAGGAPGGGYVQAVMPLYAFGALCPSLDPGMIYQELPWVHNGDQVEASFWYKVVADDPGDQPSVAMNGQFGFTNGSGYLEGLNDGLFTAAPGDANWHQMTYSYTYVLAAGDTANFCLGGHGQASSNTGLIYFDNATVVVSVSTGLAPTAAPGATAEYDALAQRVTVRADEPITGAASCWDAMGRLVSLPMMGSTAAPAFSTAALTSGAFTLRFATPGGLYVLRFAK